MHCSSHTPKPSKAIKQGKIPWPSWASSPIPSGTWSTVRNRAGASGTLMSFRSTAVSIDEHPPHTDALEVFDLSRQSSRLRALGRSVLTNELQQVVTKLLDLGGTKPGNEQQL